MSQDPGRNLINLMIEEIQNNKKLDLCDELFAETFVNHTPPPNIANDRNGMRQLFAMTHIAFPDGRISVDDQISNGCKVWTRKTFTGTHSGDFGNVPPTGKVITYEVMDILAIEKGKLAEHWSLLDRLSLFKQMGILDNYR